MYSQTLGVGVKEKGRPHVVRKTPPQFWLVASSVVSPEGLQHRTRALPVNSSLQMEVRE